MTLPLSCSTVRTHFDEHLQAQLPPSEALALEQHLRRCPSCRKMLALEQRLRAGAGPHILAPKGFAAALLAQPHHRPGHSIQVWALLQDTVGEIAFRAFVDPLLRLDQHLRDAGTPLWQRVTGPLTALQCQLRDENQKLCRYLAFPFIHAGSQLGAALSGPTDAH